MAAESTFSIEQHAQVLQDFNATKLNIHAKQEDFASRSASFSSTGNSRLDENHSPNTINSELKDYQELFSKLKVTYLEQETKEKFLRMILSEEVEDANENENTASKLNFWKTNQSNLVEAEDNNFLLKDTLSIKKKELARYSDESTRLIYKLCESEIFFEI